MKKYIIALAAAATLTSCSEDIDKWEWPSWNDEYAIIVGGNPLTDTPYANMYSGNISLKKGEVVEFNGLEDLGKALPDNFFEPVDSKSARFLGADGEYQLSADLTRQLVYVDVPGATFPDAVFFTGSNWGHPQAGECTAENWKWDSPANSYYVPKDANANIYSTVLYLGDAPVFKFYNARANNRGEITAKTIEILDPLLLAGDGDGNFVAGVLFKSGVYDIVLDLDANTLKIKPRDFSFEVPEYKVNGIDLRPQPDAGGVLGVRLNLSKGEVITFNDFGQLENKLDPTLFTDINGETAKYTGPDGEFTIYYDMDTELIYCQNRSLGYPDCLWICGGGYGSPQAGRSVCSGWSWNKPGDINQVFKVAEGVYETQLYLAEGWGFKFFSNCRWESDVWSPDNGPWSIDTTPVPATVAIAGYGGYDGRTGYGHFTGDYIAAPEFVPGVYKIRIDTNKGICAFGDNVDESLATRKINGVELIKPEEFFTEGYTKTDAMYYKNFVLNEIDFTKDQEVSFQGFSRLEYALSPDLFKQTADGKWIFRQATGRYRMMYDFTRGLIYGEPCFDDGVYWMIGIGLAHPCSDLWMAVGSWGYNPSVDGEGGNEWPWWYTNGRIALYKEENSNKYTGTFILKTGDDFFCIYKHRVWEPDFISSHNTTIFVDGQYKNPPEWENFFTWVFGDAGRYTLTLNTDDMTVNVITFK